MLRGFLFMLLAGRMVRRVAVTSSANGNVYSGLFSGFTIAELITNAGFFIALLAPIVMVTRMSPKIGARLLKIFVKQGS